MRRSRRHHIRLVTWNVHSFIGTDGVHDPKRTARIIRALDPDVLALQEVDSRDRPHNGMDIFSYLKKAIGGHAMEAKSISTTDGHYGQMLISRWPLHNPRIHDISVDGREPRRVMEAHMDLHFGPLRVIATHLGLDRKERRMQFSALAEISRTDAGTPRVLMGDFNDWRARGQGHRALSALFESYTLHRTYPAWLPILPLDRIWCRPGHLVARSWAARSMRHASDHLPLVADLDFRTDR